MAWQKKSTPEHRETVDLRTGMHLIPLIEPESGAEHRLQINIGHQACPHCGHAKAAGNLDELDVAKIVADEIAELNLSHGDMAAYAAKHRVQVRKVKAAR